MFQELQFSERGRILGAKTLTYAFDKTRTTSVPINERTYHVFYALLAGTTVDEKTALHINFSADYFHYLNQSKCINVPDYSDEIAFQDLKSALKICGFKAKTVTQIFQLLAAILHLGNLQFVDNREGDMAEETCSVKNVKVLETVSAMLGVSPSKLETALTYKLRLIRKELCTAFMNAQGATEQRDSLAQALYHVLFTWIVESINSKICYNDNPANFIGILDQFGFQNFKDNGFEEFSVNLANERVHQFYIQQCFSDDVGIHAIMVRDGVQLPEVETMDNQYCLDLLTGHGSMKNPSAGGAGGIINMIDRDCARYQSGATDATDANLLANLQRQFATHSAFAKTTQTYSFGINHFSGTVHYTVDGFIEKNIDALSPDFVTLLRDNSSNVFVNSLFQSSAMATESHPKDNRTIVKAQLTSKPTRAPSMKRSNKRNRSIPHDMEKKEAAAEEPVEHVTTVMDQLCVTLDDLFKTMSDTHVYNLIHIRPNDLQTPDMFDTKRVKSQIRTFLLPDLTLRCRQQYANYYAFDEFLARYERLIQSLNIDGSKQERDMVGDVCAIMNWTPAQAYIGNDMIWLAYDTWKELEDNLRAAEKENRARHKAINDGTVGGADTGTDVMSDAAAGGPNYPPYDSYQEMPPAEYMDHNAMGRSSFFEDGASYADSEYGMKREVDGSQWGDESEWGMKGLSEG